MKQSNSQDFMIKVGSILHLSMSRSDLWPDLWPCCVLSATLRYYFAANVVNYGIILQQMLWKRNTVLLCLLCGRAFPWKWVWTV